MGFLDFNKKGKTPQEANAERITNLPYATPLFEDRSSSNEMQLILSKIEQLGTRLRNIEERLKILEDLDTRIRIIEKIAEESQRPQKRW